MKLSYHLLLLLSLVSPIKAIAQGFPSFASKIPGVQIWELSVGEHGFLTESFEGRENEFLKYCNGSRSLYIGSNATPIKCKTTPSDDGSTFNITLSTKDPKLSGVVVVSKRQLSSRVTPLPITDSEKTVFSAFEAKQYPKVLSEEKDKYIKLDDSFTKAGYASAVSEIKKEAAYKKLAGARYKITTSGDYLYISSVGISQNQLGWEMVNAAFTIKDNEPNLLGYFYGCIKGFRDINNDGSPEILTSTCDSNEGNVYSFITLYPSIQSLVWRSQ